ncbi:hypothetical protein LDENG_00283820 [Lucifuga dentata]|nr:hypothetical protein LDENG_00283820 [Lucifuga dentata]
MSPNLNPIDLWNVLKRKVEQRQLSKFRPDRNHNRRVANISQRDSVHSMPRCAQAVLANNGGSTV